MILEGLVITLNADDTPNIAPMGPDFDSDFANLLLKPFRTSRTYQNLKQLGEGVFHVTDDVELLAQAAVGLPLSTVALAPANFIRGHVLTSSCRAYEFKVTELDEAAERTRIRCQVVKRHWFRDFLGFNRAKHAVLEAAILATRIGILPAEQIRDELQRLVAPVEKTAGDQERRAFAFLQSYIAEKLALPSGPASG